MTASSDQDVDIEVDAVIDEIEGAVSVHAGYVDFRGSGMLRLWVNVPEGYADAYNPAVLGITELRDRQPHLGDAVMTVHNVVPFRGCVLFRVNVDWRSDLDCRVYFMIAKR